MRRICLPMIGTVAAWRVEARKLALAGVPADAVSWSVGDAAPDLFDGGAQITGMGPSPLRVPREAVTALETALCHSDPERFSRAYAVLLRLGNGQLRWGDRSDPALHRLLRQEKAVRRDIHKMHAFVRFRELPSPGPGTGRRAFAAWFEPDHFITEAASPFFARRFGDMDWAIATPHVTARFVDGRLTHDVTGDVVPPPQDATEDLWRTYFASIFNPARLMVSAMTSEMPRKYWKNLPEARLVPELIRSAPDRARAMQAALPSHPPAHLARLVPPAAQEPGVGSHDLKAALDACRRCPIGTCATQGVAGEGPRDARVMIVGEQPGEREDLAGRPFVGPAGEIFDACAREAGLARSACYLTNAVKHFKFRIRGKRRLHQRPDAGEVEACRWWLELELKTVRPALIVAMGATAALSVTGDGSGILARRGRVERAGGTPVLITLHPAHVLRIPDPAARAGARAALTGDLRRVADWLAREEEVRASA